MGCCFSKELSSDNDNEKIGLLQKSVVEKEPENKISKTLSSLFDTLEGEELHNVENGASRAAAGINVWTRTFTRSGDKGNQRPNQSLNSISSSIYRFLTRYENLDERDKNSDIVVTEQNSESVPDPLCMGTDRQGCSEDGQPLSCVPVCSDQGLQEEISPSDHLCYYIGTCENSFIEKERLLNVQISGFKENNNSLNVSSRVRQGENPICVDDKQCENSGKEFYSICVIDPDCLHMEKELCTPMYGAAAGEECHSAVTSEGIHRVDWPLDNRKECSVSHAIQGAGKLQLQQQELSPQDMLGLNEVKEIFSKVTKPSVELLVDSDPPCEANVDSLHAESLRAKSYTKPPKDYTERSTLHNIGQLHELNINIDSDSLKCMCAIPEERKRHSSGIGSQIHDSSINLLNDTSYIEENDESKAVTVIVDQSLNFKNEGENQSTEPLKDNDYFHSNASRPDSFLSFDLDGINLSPKRFITLEGFGNKYLLVHANFGEVALSRLDDRLDPVPLPGPLLMKEKHPGESILGNGSPRLVNRGALSLQSENSSSYQDENRIRILETESHGKESVSALKSWCQADLCASSKADKARTQTCDLTDIGCESDVEGTIQMIDNFKVRISQGVPPNSESHDNSRSLQGILMSSASVFTCIGKEERERGLHHKTEDKVCVKNLFSMLNDQLNDPHSLENAKKESQETICRETSEEDIENVKSDSKTTLDWEIGILKYKAIVTEDALACVCSSITENSDLEISQVEKINETYRVSQSSNSVTQKTNVVEKNSIINSGESPKQKQIYSEPTEEVSDSFGNNSSKLSKPKLTCEKKSERLCLQKTSIDPNIIDCLCPCGTIGYANDFKQRNARSMLKESPLNGEMHFMGNFKVTFKNMELSNTSDGRSCLVNADPTQVDRYTAIPFDVPQVMHAVPVGSKEIVVPSSDNVLSLTEDTLNISENSPKVNWQSFPEDLYSHYLNEFSYYPVGGLAGQIFSERLANGYGGYQVGYLLTNTIAKDASEDEQVFSEDLHSKPQDLEDASFSLEQTPYQLPVSMDSVVWGWPSRGGQLVPTTKVSELNPNAKVWGTHMLHLEASSAAVGVSAAWEEVPSHRDCGQQGLDASGDGDKSQENAALPDLQESDQTDMNTLALDHSEYESLPENIETEALPNLD
ncbi:la-related protein 4B isoform X2 [Callospermophilus lateralis]|uniref:la-related protein 4B isoform X2 n=1 Tax=Callospermophilus lateralis TaxID=76772 RepID=UPI004038C82A